VGSVLLRLIVLRPLNICLLNNWLENVKCVPDRLRDGCG